MKELTAKQEDFLLEQAREKAVELKTLQDLSEYREDPHCPCVSIEELKAEAVKWVKEWKKEYNYIGDGEYEFRGKKFRLTDWIKHFFNLTSEDLA